MTPFYHYIQKNPMYGLHSSHYKNSNSAKHKKYYQEQLKYTNPFLRCINNERSTSNNLMGKIRILHAAPNLKYVDIYLNDKRIIQNISYKQVCHYLTLPIGNYQVDVYHVNTKEDAIFSRRILVKENNAYTFAIIENKQKIDLFIMQDQTFIPDGETKLRFAHLSPDTPTINIGVVQTGDNVFAHYSYKQVTEYLGLTPMSVDLIVKLSKDGYVVKDLPTIQLKADKAYTLFLIGLKNGDPPLEAIILTYKTDG